MVHSMEATGQQGWSQNLFSMVSTPVPVSFPILMPSFLLPLKTNRKRRNRSREQEEKKALFFFSIIRKSNKDFEIRRKEKAPGISSTSASEKHLTSQKVGQVNLNIAVTGQSQLVKS